MWREHFAVRIYHPVKPLRGEGEETCPETRVEIINM
jgi:hypothetical protein